MTITAAQIREIVQQVLGQTPTPLNPSPIELLGQKIAQAIVEQVNALPNAKSAPGGGALDLAKYIDHTLLKPEATTEQIIVLCHEALRYNFAAVCVNPSHVKLAAQQLRGSPVKTCTVIGFPLGATTAAVKSYEAQQAIRDGATEVDRVMNIGALKSGNERLVEQDIAAVAQTAHRNGAICKVILETALLTDEEKIKACQLAKNAGADFVKTSTGFGGGGARQPRHSLNASHSRAGYRR